MKHKWGEMSLIVAAAWQSLGNLANVCLKDTDSSWSFTKSGISELELSISYYVEKRPAKDERVLTLTSNWMANAEEYCINYSTRIKRATLRNVKQTTRYIPRYTRGEKMESRY